MTQTLISKKKKEKKPEKNEKNSRKIRKTSPKKTLSRSTASKNSSKILSPLEKLKQKFQALVKPQRTRSSKNRRDLFKALGKIWTDNSRQKKSIAKAKKEIKELKKKAENIKCFKIESKYKPKRIKKKRVNWYQLTPRAKKKKRILAERAKRKKAFRFTNLLRVFGKLADISNAIIIKAFVTKLGKIKSRRKTRIFLQDQRRISKLIKKARSFQVIPCLSLVKFGIFRKFRKKFKRYNKYTKKTSWKSTPKFSKWQRPSQGTSRRPEVSTPGARPRQQIPNSEIRLTPPPKIEGKEQTRELQTVSSKISPRPGTPPEISRKWQSADLGTRPGSASPVETRRIWTPRKSRIAASTKSNP